MFEITIYLVSFFLGVLVGFKFDFLVDKNDWYPVWVTTENWIDKDTDIIFDYCYFEIFYSKSRGKFKLKLQGYKPKYAKGYTKAVDKLNELINEKENNI